MSLKQKAISSALWSVAQRWGSQLVSFITFALLARLLDTENFGLIALAGTFLAFISLFIDQGFTTAIIQRQDLEAEHLNTAFWTNVSISGLMTLISIAVAGVIANFFSQPNLTPVIRWLSINFFINSFTGVQTALFQRKLDFKPLALRSLIATITGGVVGVSMALMGYGIWSLVGQQIANCIMQVIVLWWASDWRPQFSFSHKHFRDLFSFGINIIGINILGFLVTRSDNLLIGYFLGPVALGYYDLAYRLLLIVSNLFIGVISSTAMPIFSTIQGDLPRLRNVLYSVVQLSNTVAFPVFLGMSALAPELIIVLFGKQWEPSIPVMQILNLIGILYAGFYFNSPLIMAIGKPNWKLGLDLIRTICYLFVFYISVKWGIVAVATSYVLTAYLMSFATVWVLKKLIHIDIKVYIYKYLIPLISSLIMVFAILLIKFLIKSYFLITDELLLIIGIAVGVVTYPLSIRFIDPVSFEKVKGLIKKTILKVKNT